MTEEGFYRFIMRMEREVYGEDDEGWNGFISNCIFYRFMDIPKFRNIKMTDKIYKKQVGGDHYKSMVIQPSEFINRNNIPFAEGNAIKYLCRHKQKNQKEN